MTMTKKDAFTGNQLQLQNLSLTFSHIKKELLSATSVLCRSLIAHNTTTSLEKPICTNYVDFDNCKDRIEGFFGPNIFPINWMYN